MTKRILALTICAIMIICSMGLPAFAEEYVVSSQEELNTAIEKASSGDNIVLGEGEYEFPVFANKDLTFKGTDREKVIVNDAPAGTQQGWSGSSFHFENLTAKGATSNYYGLANGVVAVTYTDCNVNNLRFLYATDYVSFENCAFNSGTQEHSFWTYGASDVTVKNCTFSYADRAVNCYGENAPGFELDINFLDCSFKYTGADEEHEGAIEINSSAFSSVDVGLANCTGENEETISFISKWDNTNGENAKIKKLVAEIDGEYYTNIDTAIGVAEEDDTIVLLADTSINEGTINATIHNARYASTNTESDDPSTSLFFAPYQNKITSYNVIMGAEDDAADVTLNGSYIGAGASLLSGVLTVKEGAGLYGSDEKYKSWMNVNVNAGYKIGLGNLLVYGSESDIDVTYDSVTPVAKIDLENGAEMARFGKIYVGSDQHDKGENAYVLNVAEGATVKEFGELTTRGDGTVNLAGAIDSYATKSWQSSSAAVTSMHENAKNGGHINNNGVINVSETGSIRIDFMNIGRKWQLEDGNAKLNIDGGKVDFRQYINVGYDKSARIGEINLRNGAELISTDSEYTLQYNNGKEAGVETKTCDAGTLTIGAAASGTVTMDATSRISVGTVTLGELGSIVIDAENLAYEKEVTVIEQTSADATSLEGKITIENGEGVVAKYADGDVVLLRPVAEINGVKYASLQSAFDAVKNGETITILKDMTIDSETYTIPDGTSITLDMNGKKFTVTDNKTVNYELFYIYGGLTVIGDGTIELTATNNRNWNAMSTIFHNRGGVLNIESGTYTNKGGTDMAYAVDNSGNYFGDATTTISGTTALDSSYIAIRNRMEQNNHGASGKAILKVTDGTITGVKRAIWAQAASTDVNYPATGEITISGGTINGLIDTARSDGAKSLTTISGGIVQDITAEEGELKITGGSITGLLTILDADGDAVESDAIISGGVFSENMPAAYLANGYELIRNGSGTYEAVASDSEEGQLTANTISVVYKDITGDAEGKKVYQIIAKANGEDQINEFASAQLSFENTSKLLNGKDMPYVIEAADKMTLSTKQGEPDYYGFAMVGLNADGDEYYEVTSNEVILGTVTFEGYGEVSFKTAGGMVNATTVSDNLVDTYSLDGAKDDDATTGALVINTDIDETYIGKIDGETIEVPVRDLAINIDFPNAVANQKKAYQDMKVVISGGDLTENIEIELGSDAEETALTIAGKTDAKYSTAYDNNEYAITVTDALTLNRAYTVTVSGAGYRTARYTVTMTKDKELNFWNNVMDEETAVEEGELSEKKNFLAGDIVKDNNINIYDLSAVVSYFGTDNIDTEEKSDYAKYDLNRDGVIDSRDVAYVLVSWGE